MSGGLQGTARRWSAGPGPVAAASAPRSPRWRGLKPQRSIVAESTLHCIEVVGCVFSTASALALGEARLALWSLSALLTSLAALHLLHRRRSIYSRRGVREWLYCGMRLHRAFAIVGMRRALKQPLLPRAAGLGSHGSVYFLKAVLVNSSILPVLMQSLVLQLPLGLQAAVQVAVAAVILRSTPAYCSALAADGVSGSQFRWLAQAQSRVSALVMAATTSSRVGFNPSDVPCSVSLSHLVLVFELIVPILCIYLWEASPSPVSNSAAGASSAGGGAMAGTQAAASPASPADPSTSCGAGGSSGARAGRNGREDAPAAAAEPLRSGRGSPAGQPSDAQLHPFAHPSPVLVALFGVGLSGVLFDVLCTMHTRMAVP